MDKKEVLIVGFGVVVDQAEREHDVHLVWVVGLRKQGKRCKLGRMLAAGAKTWPEATAGDDLSVGSATVVVGSQGGTCRHVALSHHTGRDQE